jgi:hypothetical protein
LTGQLVNAQLARRPWELAGAVDSTDRMPRQASHVVNEAMGLGGVASRFVSSFEVSFREVDRQAVGNEEVAPDGFADP